MITVIVRQDRIEIRNHQGQPNVTGIRWDTRQSCWYGPATPAYAEAVAAAIPNRREGAKFTALLAITREGLDGLPVYRRQEGPAVPQEGGYSDRDGFLWLPLPPKHPGRRQPCVSCRFEKVQAPPAWYCTELFSLVCEPCFRRFVYTETKAEAPELRARARAAAIATKIPAAERAGMRKLVER